MKKTCIFIIIHLCFSSVLAVLYVRKSLKFRNEDINNWDNIGHPLILTHLLNEGKLKEARKEAEVKFHDFKNIKSYSGYFTVDKTYNSNLFFWFFPSINVDYKKAPVVLWLQGGPGSSSLFGLFYENGPFRIAENGTIGFRNTSWANKHSMVYIDNPVGTGFSFTTRGGYAQNQTAVSRGLYKALLQFFKLFPELQKNEFYITGESYAGKYVPVLAHTIHVHKNRTIPNINLKGIAIGNGVCDPKHQVGYGDYLYQVGLIDLNVKTKVSSLEKKIVSQIRKKQWSMAFSTWNDVLYTLEDVSGFSTNYNYLKADDFLDEPSQSLIRYLQRGDVKAALHVGNVSFQDPSDTVYSNLEQDMMKSVASFIVELLKHYRVLFYSGQLDVIVAYPLTERFLRHLKFNKEREYKEAVRYRWYVGDQLSGYVKQVGNLTEVLVRNAGHIVPMDQPDWALDLISKFIANESLDIED